ncbi:MULTISPECIES: flagellar basal body rod protein FlgG [Lysinibacillus]|uniref:flagellar basal body rod protein FlgG n=1 Tax=Lysinibacillus TaxID=400634 RepID=UPI00237D4911|nr:MULTISPECIES: flagellar basal body rod protein FlgG [Lysinibacillus]WDU80572.1 flagellar basal body rod protein FlgG [Lysinibacillus sp. G01H]
MLRSMYSGISGLKNFQTKLDVIGNNIANVNTYGFKKGRVIFKDLMSQTSAGASAPSGTIGGINPKQVGLGAELASIDTIHNPGSRQYTGRGLDLAIEGEGFFIVGDLVSGTGEGTGETPFTNTLYTRAGNFYMDEQGFLVNADGKYLMGSAAASSEDLDLMSTDFEAPAELDEVTSENLNVDGTWGLPTAATENSGEWGRIRIPTDAKSMSIAPDGQVTFVDANGDLKWGGQLVMAKFSNAGGLEKVGGNYYTVSANSGEPYLQAGGQAGLGKPIAGSLEMSNVDLSEEFTEMIVAQRGFQANTRIITTSDEILQELVNLKR